MVRQKQVLTGKGERVPAQSLIESPGTLSSTPRAGNHLRATRRTVVSSEKKGTGCTSANRGGKNEGGHLCGPEQSLAST